MASRLVSLALLSLTIPLFLAPRDEGAAPPNIQARLDRFGDPLPAGAVARLGTVRWRHVGASYVAWVKSNRLASIADGELRLWDVGTGKVVRAVKTGQEGVPCSVISADGRLLAVTAPTGVIRLFDVSTGKEVRRIETSWEESIISLAFSPDGKLLAARPWYEPVVGLWDVRTGKKGPAFEKPREDREEGPIIRGGLFDPGHSLAFSLDGKLLASATEEGVVALWRTTNGKLVFQGKGSQGTPATLAFSPDGKLLAWEKEYRAVCLVDAVTGKERWTLRDQSARCLAFSLDGKVLASADAGAVRIWDTRTGKPLRQLEGDLWHASCVAFSPDGKTLAATARNRVGLWDVATGKEVAFPGGNLGPVLAAAFSSDGKRVVTATVEGAVVLWEANTGRLLRRLQQHGEPVTAVGFSPDDRTLVAYAEEAGLTVWRAASGKRLLTRKEDCGPGPVIFTADGKALVQRCDDRTACIRELLTGKVLYRFAKFGPNANTVDSALSMDGRCMAVYSRLVVQVGEVFTGRRHPPFKVSEAAIEEVSLSPDGKAFVIACVAQKDDEKPRQTTVRLIETATGQERGRWRAQGEALRLTFAPDGQAVAFGIGGEAHVRAAKTGNVIARLRGHEGGIWHLAYSADGTRLVSAGLDTTALVWSLPRPRKQPANELTGPQLAALWGDLARLDARRAHRAIESLAEGRSARFLEGKLRQEARAAEQRHKRFVARVGDLGSTTFDVRERASDELGKGADWAEPALRQALAKPLLDLEVRRRIERLLAKRDGARPSAEWLRIVRALETLERMNDREARRALEAISREGAEGPVAQEAITVLHRLARRPVSTP
jgi:WD40 repeat protein